MKGEGKMVSLEPLFARHDNIDEVWLKWFAGMALQSIPLQRDPSDRKELAIWAFDTAQAMLDESKLRQESQTDNNKN